MARPGCDTRSAALEHTIWGVSLCLCRLLKVGLQLGRELSFQHSWRGISSANEAVLVCLLHQLLLVQQVVVRRMAAVCMLLSALSMRLMAARRHPACPQNA